MSVTMYVPRLLATLLVVAVLMVAAVPAQAGYRLLPIVRLDDRTQGRPIESVRSVDAGPLNDPGQFCFTGGNKAGRRQLVRYDAGHLIPLVVAGGDGPAGKWPEELWFHAPASMPSWPGCRMARRLPI